MDINTFLNNGGAIVYILIALNIVGFTLIILKIINILSMKKEQHLIVENISDKISENYNLESHISELIQVNTTKYEFGLNTIKTIATISPLIGLLGTVLGILLSFDTISKVGLDDPTLFSSNISLALITTVVGLIVAIPHFIFYNYYVGILNKNELEINNKILENI
jgi:biopolymer transport protein ExbB